jgi:hypothetical protein
MPERNTTFLPIRIHVPLLPNSMFRTMKKLVTILAILCIGLSTYSQKPGLSPSDEAKNIKADMLHAWTAYKKYAWGHDVLKPLSKTGYDWYSRSLFISPIDAYSTLKIMGFDTETKRIEGFVADSLAFDADIFVKTFEVNIRVLGGLLNMYQNTGNQAILNKAIDFANRILPAFDSETGLPYYWVNLKTGQVKGDTINVAEAGSYIIEMGMLSWYTKNPRYYQAARRAMEALHERRSAIGLLGQDISVSNGTWTNKASHIGACTDSYYEYLYKGWVLFKDPILKTMWDESIASINKYVATEKDGRLWYGRVDMETGKPTGNYVTLWDAYFPAILALSGDLKRAERLQESWDYVWKLHGVEPMVFDFGKNEVRNPAYDLNPEIIESAYYLYRITGDKKYRAMVQYYLNSIREKCRTDVAFTALADVRTGKQDDEMATFFLAETLKYLYLTFADDAAFGFDQHIFNTEAHPYDMRQLKPDEIGRRLGF